jgi:hypothetical protein
MAAAVLSGIMYGRPINSGPPVVETVSCCGATRQIANASSISARRFDVELELEELYLLNVRDFDGGEDLFGSFRFRTYFTDSKSINTTPFTMWSRSQTTASNSVGLSNGTHPVGTRRVLAANISYFDLLTSAFKVSASLSDHEDWLPPRVFTCTNCNADNNTARVFDLSALPNATASIQALQMTLPPSSQLLTLSPSFDHVTMTFAENGNTSDGAVSSRWRIRVTPHL